MKTEKLGFVLQANIACIQRLNRMMNESVAGLRTKIDLRL